MPIKSGVSGSSLGNTVESSEITDATIVAGDIANSTITGTQIALNTIIGANILTSTITTTQIAAATISPFNLNSAIGTWEKISTSTFTQLRQVSQPITTGLYTRIMLIVNAEGADDQGVILHLNNDVTGTKYDYLSNQGTTWSQSNGSYYLSTGGAVSTLTGTYFISAENVGNKIMVTGDSMGLRYGAGTFWGGASKGAFNSGANDLSNVAVSFGTLTNGYWALYGLKVA